MLSYWERSSLIFPILKQNSEYKIFVFEVIVNVTCLLKNTNFIDAFIAYFNLKKVMRVISKQKGYILKKRGFGLYFKHSLMFGKEHMSFSKFFKGPLKSE